MTGGVVADATAVGCTVIVGAGTAVVVVVSEVAGREVAGGADPVSRRVLGDAEVAGVAVDVGALEREALDPLHAPSELTAVTTRNSDTPSLRFTAAVCHPARARFAPLTRLLAFDDLDPPIGVPRLDDEPVARVVDVREHHFVDVDAKRVRVVVRIVVGNFDHAARELRLADPFAGLVGRIRGRSVNRDTRIAQEIERFRATAPSSRRTPRRRRSGSRSR